MALTVFYRVGFRLENGFGTGEGWWLWQKKFPQQEFLIYCGILIFFDGKY